MHLLPQSQCKICFLLCHILLTVQCQYAIHAITQKFIMSLHTPLTCVDPQGSILGPDLFTDYSSPVASLIRSFSVSVHCYADNTQLYCPFTPGIDEFEVLSRSERCIEALPCVSKLPALTSSLHCPQHTSASLHEHNLHELHSCFHIGCNPMLFLWMLIAVFALLFSQMLLLHILCLSESHRERRK